MTVVLQVTGSEASPVSGSETMAHPLHARVAVGHMRASRRPGETPGVKIRTWRCNVDSVEMVKDLMAQAKTSKTLTVFATILDGVYKTGRKVTEDFKQTMEIVFDDYLPQWNYTAQPQVS